MLLRALARRGVGDGMLCTHLSGVPQCEMWEDSGTHPRSARDAFPVGSGLWFRESQERLTGSARLGSARSTFTRSGTNVQRLPCGDKERKRTCAGSEALNTRGRRYGAHHH